MVDDDEIGIDPDMIDALDEAEFESGVFDAEAMDEAQESGELGWGATIQDWVTQANLGAASVFSWPLDILKVMVLGEGFSGIDELESAAQREGKPFSREAYMSGLLESGGFIPTQGAAEEYLESKGIPTKPRTAGGKAIKQVAAVAGFTPGSAAKKLTSGLTAGATTSVLKSAGVSSGAAEIAGDISSALPASAATIPRKFSEAKQKLANVADKYALPFMEFMAREKAPYVRGRIMRHTEDKLKREFNLSLDDAIEKVITDNNFAKRKRDEGVNLQALDEEMYTNTRNLARSNEKIIPMNETVEAIDQRIKDIKAAAPSPSQAEKAAINILENERDILKVANPNSEQVINQHINYNSNVKGIYRKPEFTGSEEEVRDAYAFINDQLVKSMEKHGAKDVADSFKASNKLHHEIMKLDKVEGLLQKTMKDGSIDPKALGKLLQSKNGKFVKRSLGETAMNDLTEIARYGETAQTNMSKFIDLQSPYVRSDIQAYGELAPLLFSMKGLAGVPLFVTRTVSKRIQGKILTSPAARKEYKILLKDAANQQYQLLKGDFFKLEQAISKEYGSVDNFVDDVMADIANFDED